jgi:DNA polymerase-3 subunit gamma/tau
MAKAKASPVSEVSKEMPEETNSDRSDGRYVVVARRYRPRSFDQLVGQQHIGQALCNAIETGRVGHAYLFTGARGVGKTSTARIFAKALNDPSGPTSLPTGDSDIARAIDSGEDVDVLEIDGASNRGIDEIRSLRAGVGVRPSRSRYKIYIIDEVHMLTPAAFNALLKTLEEPPPHVKFIFCTTDPDKIPITVLSRCQRFDFAPVSTDSILGRLKEIVRAEGISADDEALRLIARRAEGSMRDSQSLLEQVMSFSDGKLTTDTVHAMLGTADDARLHEFVIALANHDPKQALHLVERASGEGIAAGQLAEQLLGYFRDILVATVGCPAEMQRHANESLHDELISLGKKWGLQTVLAILGILDQTLVRIRHSLHGRVLFESALIQICHLPDLQAVADLAATLAGGGATSQPLGGNRVTDPSAVGQKKKADPTDPAPKEAAPWRPTDIAESLGASLAKAERPAPEKPSDTGQNPEERSFSPRLEANQPHRQSAKPVEPTSYKREPVGASVGILPPPPARPTASANPTGHEAGISGTSNTVNPPIPARSRIQLMREIEQNPYVKKCQDLFGAEIVKIDPPQ